MRPTGPLSSPAWADGTSAVCWATCLLSILACLRRGGPVLSLTGLCYTDIFFGNWGTAKPFGGETGGCYKAPKADRTFHFWKSFENCRAPLVFSISTQSGCDVTIRKVIQITASPGSFSLTSPRLGTPVIRRWRCARWTKQLDILSGRGD